MKYELVSCIATHERQNIALAAWCMNRESARNRRRDIVSSVNKINNFPISFQLFWHLISFLLLHISDSS